MVANLCNNSNCVCYGVEIPGTEGKAGMVAILDPEHSVDLELLAKQIRKKLPKYARPLFIRIIKDLPLTGTYKLMKKDLQEQGKFIVFLFIYVSFSCLFTFIHFLYCRL